MVRALPVLALAFVVVSAGCLGGAQPDAGEAGNGSDGGAKAGDSTGSSGDLAPNGTQENDTRENATWEPGDVVDEGQIAVGSPTTYVCSLTVCAGQEGVESFLVDEMPPSGAVIRTNTTDNSGTGFNLDLYFHEADGTYLGGCSDRPTPGTAGEQRCEVPEDAATGTVDAAWGADLDVQVVVAELPSP